MANPRQSPEPVFQIIDLNDDVTMSMNNVGGYDPVAGLPHVAVFHCVKKVILTSAQLKTLKATPITLVGAPVNTARTMIVTQVNYHYSFLTAGYTLNGGTLQVFLGAAANNNPVHADVATGLLDAAANRNILGIPAIKSTTDTDAHLLNQAITIANTGAAEFTVGSGTLEVVIYFDIVSIP